jgi:transposase, IS5 family
MLRDRYTPINLCALVPALSLALAPVLTQLDRLLDADSLFQAVPADLARRRPRTLIDGRPSTPVEVLLRLLVVKHLYGWSSEATEHWVSDRRVWRQCCRVSAEAVPDATTLLRWANVIQPAPLHRPVRRSSSYSIPIADGKESEDILGSAAYLNPKGRGDKSLPSKPRVGRRR